MAVASLQSLEYATNAPSAKISISVPSVKTVFHIHILSLSLEIQTKDLMLFSLSLMKKENNLLFLVKTILLLMQNKLKKSLITSLMDARSRKRRMTRKERRRKRKRKLKSKRNSKEKKPKNKKSFKRKRSRNKKSFKRKKPKNKKRSRRRILSKATGKSNFVLTKQVART